MSPKQLKEIVDKVKSAEPEVKKALGPELLNLGRKLRTAKSKLAADAYRKRYHTQLKKSMGL